MPTLLAYFMLFCCILLGSCSTEVHPPIKSIDIYGRSNPDTLSSREPIYRMQIPAEWDIVIPALDLPLIDTTEPLITLKTGDLTITFHNFPVRTLAERIPPFAQISRWKNQITQLNEAATHITPFAVGGFTGLQLEASGVKNGDPTSVMAWSMQLTPELFQKLPEGALQQKADWTLKAVGNPEAIELHQTELLELARSIELLQDIPTR